MIVRRKRLSLKNVFNLAVIGILFLFLLLSGLIYSSLFDYKTTFHDLANKSLPSVILSSELDGLSSRLLESTERLSHASSQIAIRLAEQDINLYSKQLKLNSNSYDKNEFLNIQLDTINLEISELKKLTQEKLVINKQLQIKNTEIHLLYDKALNSLSLTHDNASNSSWVLQLSKTVTKASQVSSIKRLQEVRSAFKALEGELALLKQYAALDKASDEKLKISNNLKRLVLQDEGLVLLKIKQLRIEGRVIGRENFVFNIIQDYTRYLEYAAQEIQLQVTDKLADTNRRFRHEITFTGMILIGGILFLLIILWFIQKHVIERLRILNSIVKNKIQGGHHNAVLTGNDEITDLADSFHLFTQTIEQQQIKLEHMSLSDGLTGIANRRALDLRLLHDIELSIRKKSHVAILLMDIDCFKLYNDNYGHAAGDECLKIIASCIKHALKRNSDFVARYGGEEFVCVLPDTNLAGAQDIANDIMHSVQEKKVTHEYSTVTDHITLSMGIAVSGPEQVLLPDKLLNKADKALYVAKQNGKNQFCSAQDCA